MDCFHVSESVDSSIPYIPDGRDNVADCIQVVGCLLFGVLWPSFELDTVGVCMFETSRHSTVECGYIHLFGLLDYVLVMLWNFSLE